MNIKIITGATNPSRKASDLNCLNIEGVTITLSNNKIGPDTFQSDTQVVFGAPGVIAQAIQAKNEDVDAIVIESGGDTALNACREVVDIPVTAMMDSGVRIATMLGNKYGIITAGTWHGQYIEELVSTYGLQSKYKGFEPVNLHPKELFEQGVIHKNLVLAAKNLYQRGVDTVVFGGSYFVGHAPELKEALKEKGMNMLVIDAFEAAIRTAKMLAEWRISRGPRSQINVEEEALIGYAEQFTNILKCRA